jgi:hypothetical protein
MTFSLNENGFPQEQSTWAWNYRAFFHGTPLADFNKA